MCDSGRFDSRPTIQRVVRLRDTAIRCKRLSGTSEHLGLDVGIQSGRCGGMPKQDAFWRLGGGDLCKLRTKRWTPRSMPPTQVRSRGRSPVARSDKWVVISE